MATYDSNTLYEIGDTATFGITEKTWDGKGWANNVLSALGTSSAPVVQFALLRDDKQLAEDARQATLAGDVDTVNELTNIPEGAPFLQTLEVVEYAGGYEGEFTYDETSGTYTRVNLAGRTLERYGTFQHNEAGLTINPTLNTPQYNGESLWSSRPSSNQSYLMNGYNDNVLNELPRESFDIDVNTPLKEPRLRPINPCWSDIIDGVEVAMDSGTGILDSGVTTRTRNNKLGASTLGTGALVTWSLYAPGVAGILEGDDVNPWTGRSAPTGSSAIQSEDISSKVLSVLVPENENEKASREIGRSVPSADEYF